jgi:hypothetical protein
MNGGYKKYWRLDNLKNNWNKSNISGWHSWLEKKIPFDADISEKWKGFRLK